MKIKSLLQVLSLAATLAGAATATAQAPAPKLTIAEARHIALSVAHGTIVSEEYEKENGAWRYSFEVREAGRIHEIGVDPNTGNIVENAWEDAADADEDQYDEDRSGAAREGQERH
jgi:uncharacterized membrane protein YkoI